MDKYGRSDGDFWGRHDLYIWRIANNVHLPIPSLRAEGQGSTPIRGLYPPPGAYCYSIRCLPSSPAMALLSPPLVHRESREGGHTGTDRQVAVTLLLGWDVWGAGDNLCGAVVTHR